MRTRKLYRLCMRGRAWMRYNVLPVVILFLAVWFCWTLLLLLQDMLVGSQKSLQQKQRTKLAKPMLHSSMRPLQGHEKWRAQT